MPLSYQINFLWEIRIPHAHLWIKCISKIEMISPKRKFDVLDQSVRITNGKIRQKERCNAASLTVQNFSSMVINIRCALEPSHWMVRGENCVTTCFVGPIWPTDTLPQPLKIGRGELGIRIYYRVYHCKLSKVIWLQEKEWKIFLSLLSWKRNRKLWKITKIAKKMGEKIDFFYSYF